MNAYFFKMSQAEKNNILDQHKEVYNGYVTTYGQQINQPLYVQDFANDKEGITINNKGDIKTYTNLRINEMRHDGMDTGLFSDEVEEYEYVTPKKHFDGLDQIGDGETDLIHGTIDDEDIDDVEYYIELSPEEDIEIFDEVDEDMVEPLQEQINKSLDMFKRFSKY